MKLFIFALMAVVIVNCFVEAVSGKPDTEGTEVPYIHALLPPLKDVQVSNEDASTKINATVKVTPSVFTTTTPATKKPKINDEMNIILPELSIEALLPPLFETKIEKEVATKSRTTTRTTTIRPATTTKASTVKPSTLTTLKPFRLKVPDLILDSLIPPWLGNDSVDAKEEKVSKTTTATTTQTPIAIDQRRAHPKHENHVHNINAQKQQLKHLNDHSTDNEIESHQKLDAATSRTHDKYFAESQTHSKKVSLTSEQRNVKIDATTQRHVAENNSKYFYLVSTTPRPPKIGLPTITPFPRRLGK